MRKLWHDEAWEEYLYWQSQDKKTLKKINRLLTRLGHGMGQYPIDKTVPSSAPLLSQH